MFVKPTSADSRNQLPTLSAFNNERKFEFISKTSQIDYREKPQPDTEILNSHSDSGSEQSLNNRRLRAKTAPVRQSEPVKNQTRNRKHFEDAKNHFESKDDCWLGDSKRTETNVANHFQKALKETNRQSTRKRLPWIKDEQEKDKPTPMCDIVKTRNVQSASFVNIHDDSDDSANTTDDSISDELDLSNLNYSNGHSNHSNESLSNFNSNSTNVSPTNSSEDSIEKKQSLSDLIESVAEINPKTEREVCDIIFGIFTNHIIFLSIALASVPRPTINHNVLGESDQGKDKSSGRIKEIGITR